MQQISSYCIDLLIYFIDFMGPVRFRQETRCFFLVYIYFINT